MEKSGRAFVFGNDGERNGKRTGAVGIVVMIGNVGQRWGIPWELDRSVALEKFRRTFCDCHNTFFDSHNRHF